MRKILLTAFAAFLTISIIQAQETTEKGDTDNNQEKLLVKVKDGAKPDIYVDGKKFDFPMELLDQNKIESVSVIKDEQAIKDYGAPNGVVLIKTKMDSGSNSTGVKVRGYGSMDKTLEPMLIIDGEKAAGKEALDKISPDDIISIEVIKDKTAKEKYNSPDGVIIVTTKKGNKSKK